MISRTFAIRTVAVTLLALISGCGGGGGPKSYTVTATAGSGGAVSPASATVTEGTTTSISITLNEGYEIAEVTGCGGTLTGTTYTTGPVSAACSINATFRLKKYTVTATATSGGTVTPASVSVEHGSKATFTLAASPGYKITGASGCGGALAGTAYTTGNITSACIVSTEFALDIPYQTTAIITPNIEPLYQEICGAGTVGRGLQHVAPVDLNKDARLDLVLFLWCQPVPKAADYFDGPTPSRIVTLLQTPQGQFEVKTAEIFGTDRPTIGAASDCYVIHDFNNDGQQDIVYSAKREDGRQSSPPTAINDARTAALMSDGRGRYTIEFIGSPQWGECVFLLDNATNGKDFFLSGVGNSQWTYRNGWQLVQNINFAANTGVMFFDRQTTNLPSTQAISPLNGNPDNFGLYLHRWTDGRWVEDFQTGYRIPAIRIQYTDGRQVLDGVLVTIDGKDYIWPSFGGTCQIRRSRNSTPEALVAFNGLEVVGGYRGQIVEITGPGVFFLNLFGIDQSGRLEKRAISVKNEKTYDTAPNRMRCYDVNGDGFEDVVLFATNIRNSNDVLVYLNDQNGGLSRVKPAAFPPSPSGFGSLRNYTLADVNGDGIDDLIYFQIVGDSGRENTLRIHLATRPIQARDLL